MVRVTHNDNLVSVDGNHDGNRDLHLDPRLTAELLQMLGMIKSYEEVKDRELLLAAGALIVSKIMRKLPSFMRKNGLEERAITGFDMKRIEHPVVIPVNGAEVDYVFEDKDSGNFAVDVFTDPIHPIANSKELYETLEKKLKDACKERLDIVRRKLKDLEEKWQDRGYLDAGIFDSIGLNNLVRDSALMTGQIKEVVNSIKPRAMQGEVYCQEGDVLIPDSMIIKNPLLAKRDSENVDDKSVLAVTSKGTVIYDLRQPYPDDFPYKFKVDEHTLRCFCRSAGIPMVEYERKFGDSIAPMLAAYIMVDPMVRFARCVDGLQRAKVAEKLGTNKKLASVSLYTAASMHSTNTFSVPIGTTLDIYVCPTRNRKNPNEFEMRCALDPENPNSATCTSVFYLLLVDPMTRKPFAAGTFRPAVKYFIKDD